MPPKKMSAVSRGQVLSDFCRSLAGATEDVKWETNLVFSVGGRMFAIFDLPELRNLSFKVSDDAFDTLTQQPGVIPAPYLAKARWVKLEPAEALPRELVEELLEDAHRLIGAKLSKKKQRELGLLAD